MDSIALNQTWATTASVGNAALFNSPGGKLVFEVGGDGKAIVGVYRGTQPVGANGMLKLEPGKSGVRTLPAGQYLIYVAQTTTPGPLTIKPRSWSFWDYFKFGLW